MVDGPTTRVRVYDTSNNVGQEHGPVDRAKALAELQGHVDRFIAAGPLWARIRGAAHPVSPAARVHARDGSGIAP
jgi:hypothetical protein